MLAVAAAFALLLAPGAKAQTGAIEGEIIAPEGGPLKDALVKIERVDIRGNYKVKSNKKGRYFHAGLPLGTYNVMVEVDGKMLDAVKGVRVGLGDPTPVNFNLAEVRKRQEALQAAAQTGQLSDDQMRGLSKEQREAIEKQMQERSEAMKKNKALNDAFNAGMAAKQAKQWDAAIDAFKKATELDATQHVIYANLGESYMSLADAKTGPERDAAMEQGLEAYAKVVSMKPEEPAYHNNYGLALAKAKKNEEAQAQLEKAASLDPAGAGKYFYNLGAVLVNTNQLEASGEAFKKAIEADPNYAPAQYQYGMYLVSKATTTPDGQIVPPEGTKEAFQKYLQLEPNGAFAASAQGMLQTLEATVQTQYVNPDAKKPAPAKKK
ncbi:MAG: carboxypeptidase regulatory-like domain-containing protein [Bryobacteraceae bacterium]|nr:carboxypeptidase regulatory-like domain-containing protein [Bryobacteraceae bacterium]